MPEAMPSTKWRGLPGRAVIGDKGARLGAGADQALLPVRDDDLPVVE